MTEIYNRYDKGLFRPCLVYGIYEVRVPSHGKHLRSRDVIYTDGGL